jgi:AraC-like DNA-binding protein
MQLPQDNYNRIVSAKLFIDENFHLTIGLHTIAKNACMSRYHFHRLFTSVYKITPHQYLTRKRISKAVDLLDKNEMSITEVCNSVGFESLGSFSMLFKKEIGFPPQYYRNRAWLKKQQSLKQPRQFIPHCFIETFDLDRRRTESN